MKKTLLVAALAAGFAGVAHAESSVTLYGVVDGGYGFNKTKYKDFDESSTVKVRKMGARSGVQAGSRWGLKGSEDLGNGTSVIFQLESGFNVGNGTQGQSSKDKDGNDKYDRIFGRKAIVGLTGDSWGTFTIGRQSNAADDFVSGIDPFGTGFDQASAQTLLGGNVSYRADSVIKYVSPDFSGFQFGLGLTHSDDKTTTESEAGTEDETGKKATGFTVGFGYNNGPLTLGAGFDYAKVKDYHNAFTDEDYEASSMKGWSLGAAYDFDVVKLHAMFSQQRDGVFDDDLMQTAFGYSAKSIAKVMSSEDDKYTASQVKDGFFSEGYRANAWLVGLSAPVGEAGKVMFSYQGSTAKNKELDGLKLKGSVFSLGYVHSLSKRTSVYAVASYGEVKVKTDAIGNAKLKSTDVAVGLTHRF